MVGVGIGIGCALLYRLLCSLLACPEPLPKVDIAVRACEAPRKEDDVVVKVSAALRMASFDLITNAEMNNQNQRRPFSWTTT